MTGTMMQRFFPFVGALTLMAIGCAAPAAAYQRASTWTSSGDRPIAANEATLVLAETGTPLANATTAPTPSATSPPTPPSGASAGADAIEIEFWRSIANSTDPADFKAYLNQFPNGHFRELAWARLTRLLTPSAPADICQSLVGKWVWFNDPEVTFFAGGRVQTKNASFVGSWTCNNGQVTIDWPLGIVDNLTLSKDGKHLRGAGGVFGLSVVTGDRIGDGDD
jgi:hypothetical protein